MNTCLGATALMLLFRWYTPLENDFDINIVNIYYLCELAVPLEYSPYNKILYTTK